MGLLRPAYRCYQEEVRRLLTYSKHRLTSSGVSIYTIAMGRLIYLNNLDLDASWYFPDAYYNRNTNNYAYPWPNLSYPHSVAIHQEDISNHIKVTIREWVEESIQETVIVDVVDKSYRKVINKSEEWELSTWDKSYEVVNRWVVFYFRNEHSLTIFKLKFSEYIKPVTDEHPGWHECDSL